MLGTTSGVLIRVDVRIQGVSMRRGSTVLTFNVYKPTCLTYYHRFQLLLMLVMVAVQSHPKKSLAQLLEELMLAMVAVQSDPKDSLVQLLKELMLVMGAVQYDPKKTVVLQLEKRSCLNSMKTRMGLKLS